MTFTSTELLRFLATPGSQAVRTSGVWVLKTQDGRDLEADLGGFAYSPVVIPDAMLADLVRARRVEETGDVAYRLSATSTDRAAA
jgi:hypothetical protein